MTTTTLHPESCVTGESQDSFLRGVVESISRASD